MNQAAKNQASPIGGAFLFQRSARPNDPVKLDLFRNPGRVIRYRFDEATIERLLDIAWWDWPLEDIGRNLTDIQGADIDALEQIAADRHTKLDVTSKAG